MSELPIAFADSDGTIRVNFGLLAGREATAAEVEELARELLGRLESFSIVCEQRFEFGREAEASVHQVRIELELPIEEELRGRVLEIAERWATGCAAARHANVVTPYPGRIDRVETS